MTFTARPNAGKRVHCARDSRLITTIRMNDRATKSPVAETGLLTVIAMMKEIKS